jgi:ribA/ribD-fused uncharacterized protein
VSVIGHFSGPNGFLSNFYTAPFTHRDICYATMEHFFQAQKTTSKSWRLRISRVATPGDAKRLGRQVPLREDWEAIKHDMMMKGLRLKFPSPDHILGTLLLDTGDAMLIEGNTWGDKHWGAQYDLEKDKWNGKNWLGSLLMVRRAELRSRV